MGELALNIRRTSHSVCTYKGLIAGLFAKLLLRLILLEDTLETGVLFESQRITLQCEQI